MGMQTRSSSATISYRSGDEWQLRFGRNRIDPNAEPNLTNADFLMEQYLQHQVSTC